MKPPAPLPRPCRAAPAALALLLASTGAAASNCEAISAGIDARIRASGVARFTLSTVDAQANVPGKVVGSCDRGSRKIVYVKGDDGAPSAAPAAPAAPAATAARASAPASPRKGSSVITECKDGSMPVDGRCKR